MQVVVPDDSHDDAQWSSIENFQSICAKDTASLAYRNRLMKRIMRTGEDHELEVILSYLASRVDELSYNLVAHAARSADIPRFVDAAYTRVGGRPPRHYVWHRIRMPDNPDLVRYFRTSSDGSGQFVHERPADMPDDHFIDIGQDEIFSCRQELVAVTSVLQFMKSDEQYWPFEFQASMAYRASEPNFNARVLRSGQKVIWAALSRSPDAVPNVYARFRQAIWEMREACGADGRLTANVEGVGRLYESLRNGEANTSSAALDTFKRFASWDTHQMEAEGERAPEMLRSIAATLIVLGQERYVLEVAGSFLDEGDELIEAALDGGRADFVSALYKAVPPLTAAESVFDALAGVPRLTEPESLIRELRKALGETTQQAASRSRNVADEALTRVLNSIGINVDETFNQRYEDDMVKLRKAYRAGGSGAVRRLIGELIDYNFFYPRAFADGMFNETSV